MIKQAPTFRSARWIAVTAGAMLLFAPIASAFTVPVNDGYVTDMTGTLSQEQDGRIEEVLRAFDEETSNQIAVLLVQTLSGSTVNDAGVEVGRAWGVGTKENDNGILMLIALGDRQLGILTGYGLEGAVPDIVAKGIIEEDVTPLFREGKYEEGILAGVESLKKHIGGEYTAERYGGGDGGGFFPGILVFLFILLDLAGAFLARSKSWWLGGVLGGVLGSILVLIFGWWLSVPVLVVLGLLFDYIASRTPSMFRRRGGRFWGGWGGGWKGGGGGGFGGFGGGSFGGGGASGKW
ncbi:MAG: TPM domain-containing protein [Patescibacteria group bacterium]